MAHPCILTPSSRQRKQVDVLEVQFDVEFDQSLEKFSQFWNTLIKKYSCMFQKLQYALKNGQTPSDRNILKNGIPHTHSHFELLNLLRFWYNQNRQQLCKLNFQMLRAITPGSCSVRNSMRLQMKIQRGGLEESSKVLQDNFATLQTLHWR
jgi:hypothetical protein